MFGGVAACTFVLFAIGARYPAPSWDDWEWLTWLLSEPPSFRRLFIPHNEHVIPIARLLFWLQYRLQGAHGSLLFWISLASQIAVGAVCWREIARRWPRQAAARSTAFGGVLLTLFFAWQLHSIVIPASVLHPLVLLFAALTVSTSLTAVSPSGRAQLAWSTASVAASLGAMLTTTAGLVVPAIAAGVVVRQRSSRALALAHAILAIAGPALYLMLTRGGLAAASGDARSAMSHAPIVIAYFLAFFGSFITYGSTTAGVITGGILLVAGLILSVRVMTTWSEAPRIEWFALGIMAFAIACGLMAAIGRAEQFDIAYAAQSRYSTYAMAYWAALLLLWLSVVERNTALRISALASSLRWIALPSCLVLLAVHVLSGIIWLAKADNAGAARLAVAADVHDDEWVRTLHPSPDVVFHARALAAVRGDTTVASVDLGRKIALEVSTPQCDASLSLTPAPEGPALRVTGTANMHARSAWILNPEGVVVGLAARAPIVDRPDPTGAEAFTALRRAWGAGELLSRSRWIGFAPATAPRPLTFVASESGRPVCRSAL